MKVKRLWLAMFLFGTASTAFAEDTRFLHQPDISAQRIVFVNGHDLWTVPRSGGEAVRLTSHRGVESNPKFSPDGAWIAFSGQYGGNVDVYVISARGGAPRRITYHPGDDHVQGWSADGSKILFSSARFSNHRRPQLLTIDAEGGYPEVFPMHKAFMGAFSPDGKKLAFTPNRNAFLTWKRYRGGETTPIWLVDLEDYSHLEIPHENASDTFPVWLGDSVFFLSDRNDVMSVFGYDTKTGAVEERANNGITDIDYLSGAHGNLVYSSGGYLFVYDITSESRQRISVTVRDDRVQTVPRHKNVSEEIRSADISPDGSHVVFEAHGELLVVSTETGKTRNLTRAPGSAERDPAWSPDGKSIAYFSDVDGEYTLHVADRSGAGPGPVTKIGVGERGFFSGPVWSPDSKKIAYADKTRRLWYVDITTKKQTRIDCRIAGNDTYVWSPDSRWLAYGDMQPTLFRSLKLHSLESEEPISVTDGMGDAYYPAFSHDGSYLFFLGSTDVGQVNTGLDLSTVAHQNEVTWEIFAVLLRKDVANPFAPGARERGSGPVVEPGFEMDKAPFRIDGNGIERRIVRLPLSPGRYSNIKAAADGTLFFREEPSERTFGGKPKLRRFDMGQGEATDFLTDVKAYDLSAEGKTVLYLAEEDWGIVPAASRPEAGSGKLDVSGMEVFVDPAAEWRQMFHEAWRIERDFFYDEDMHGVDWGAMRKRYEAYLPDVYYRSDLNYVIRQMVGELVNSHIRVGGGDIPELDRVPGGLLGADYEVVNDRYRIKRIITGSYWDRGEESNPLIVPGVDVKEGDYVLEVNGQDLRYPANIHSLFVNTAGKEVTLRVGNEPRLEASRLVTVVPLESERALRRRDWIEDSRKKVDELSDGQIAYIYQPNTGRASLREFDRYFFPQSDKVAVIIDERFNDGGDDPDYQLDILDRQQVHWYVTRNGGPFKSPFSMIDGPKVMLINAEAGSGGDVYPYQFQIRELGSTVGTRTWGGVMGGGSGPRLMDGGYVRAPGLGTYSPDGDYVLENSGHTPDFEVYVYPEDDFQGRDPQLEKAVSIIMEELRQKPPRGIPAFEKVDRSLKRREKETTSQ